MFDGRENRMLRRALALYAGDHVLEQVLREGERFLKPNTAPAMLTMVYFDCSSVATDPSAAPETMFEWQRAYAETITRAFFEAKGTFDTFIGDNGIGWWNAAEHDDHADREVECSLRLAKAVGLLHRENTSFPAARLRIGIHSGWVGLGNYGSSMRLRYCVIGAGLNIAARLASALRDIDTEVLVSDDTFTRLRDKRGLAEAADLVKLSPGQPIRVYVAPKGTAGASISPP